MKLKRLAGFALLLFVIAFPLFNYLDALPLREWDESRLAISAIEMMHSHNWIVPTYTGQPDMWSTKPPLMIWLQILSMKALGINELAVRLPAALAALVTCMLMLLFFIKKYRQPLLGCICVMILVTCHGYVTMHGTRTGDYDSLLTMCMVAYAGCFYLFLDNSRSKYLYLTFLFLILAVLTKGIQGCLFTPAMFLYAFYHRKVLFLLRQKEFYIGIAAFLFFVAGYYWLRERYNPGYWDAVVKNELSGRYMAVLENHTGHPFYYFNLLLDSLFHQWYVLVLPGILLGIASTQKWIKDITVFSAVIIVSYLLIISGAKTQLDWYLLPIYPFLAIAVGIFLYTICLLLENVPARRMWVPDNLLSYVFIFIIVVAPYNYITDPKNDQPKYVSEAQLGMERFIQSVLHGERNIEGGTLLMDEFKQNYLWYYLALKENHHSICMSYINDVDQGGLVVAYLPDSKERLEANYYTDVVQRFDSVTVYRLKGKKE